MAHDRLTLLWAGLLILLVVRPAFAALSLGRALLSHLQHDQPGQRLGWVSLWTRGGAWVIRGFPGVPFVRAGLITFAIIADDRPYTIGEQAALIGLAWMIDLLRCYVLLPAWLILPLNWYTSLRQWMLGPLQRRFERLATSLELILSRPDVREDQEEQGRR